MLSGPTRRVTTATPEASRERSNERAFGRSQMPSQCAVRRPASRTDRLFAFGSPGGAGGLRVAIGGRIHEQPGT
jgi:hypothetical protein